MVQVFDSSTGWSGSSSGGTGTPNGNNPHSNGYQDANVPETGTLQILLGEGRIEGLYNGLQSAYLDATPIMQANGSTSNFNGVAFALVAGTNTQPAIQGISGVESETSVNVQVPQATPVTRTVTSNCDGVRVRIAIPALSYTDPSNGNYTSNTVTVKIERKHATYTGGVFQTVTLDNGGIIKGGPYSTKLTKAYRIDTPVAGSWDIRVTRVSADDPDIYHLSQTWWEAYTEIIDAHLRYPNSAVASIRVNAKQFSTIPQATFDILGTRVLVPSNYVPRRDLIPTTVAVDATGKTFTRPSGDWTADGIAIGQQIKTQGFSYPGNNGFFVVSGVSALVITCSTAIGLVTEGAGTNRIVTRPATYYTSGFGTTAGAWDGTFGDRLTSTLNKPVWTENPAWIWLDAATATRYGAGSFLSQSGIDKWSLYTVAVWADTLVNDGTGGLEPRMACNLYLQSNQNAITALGQLASVFFGVVYYASGLVSPVADFDASPVSLFTNANVTDGRFSYEGTARQARHTAAVVRFQNPALAYDTDAAVYEDAVGISRYGYNPLDTQGLGCTTQGQALRLAKWLIYTELLSSETISFTSGLEGSVCKPGDIIEVSDQFRAGSVRFGGRVASVSPALGDGVTASFTFNGPSLYKTDWQGTQLLYSTARTNLATYSQLLTQTNPWYLYNATIPSTISAPDGTTTAKVVQEDSTTNSHGIEWSTSSAPYTAGQAVPYVFFVKRNSGTRNLRFTSISGANGMRVTLNLDTLAVANASYGDASFTSGTITPLSNGYYRIDLLGIPSAATSASSQNLYFDMLNAGANTYLGDGTSGLAIWGLMIGAVGSYIPTTTAPVTLTDYTVSGTTATFTPTPAAGCTLTGVSQGGTVNAIPLDAPVTLGAGAYTLRVQTATGTQSQTVNNGAGTWSRLNLSSPLTAAPAAGASWLLQSGTTASLWRVLSVSKGDNLKYSVTALKHDPTKYTSLGLNTGDVVTRVGVTPVTPTVTGLAAGSGVMVLNDRKLQTLTASWNLDLARGYAAQAQNGAGPWRDMTVTGASALLVDIEPGVWTVRVASDWREQGWSPFVTATFTVTDSKAIPLTVQQADNLIQNPTGEMGTMPGYGGALVVSDAGNSYAGTYCRKLDASATNQTALTPVLPCVYGDQFSFDCYVKGSNGTVAAQLVLKFTDATSSVVGTSTSSAFASATYQSTGAFLGAVPATAVGVQAFIQASTTGASQFLYFDNLSLRRATRFQHMEVDAGFRSANAIKNLLGTGTTSDRTFYAGSNDATTKGGAPNIGCLTVTPQVVDTTAHCLHVDLKLQPTTYSDNLDSLRYAQVTLYGQSAPGTTATLTAIGKPFQVSLSDRTYNNTTDSNARNASISSGVYVNAGISGSYVAMKVVIWNAYGPSDTHCYYSGSSWTAGSALTDNGTSWPAGITGGTAGGTDSGGGGGGTCPAPWVLVDTDKGPVAAEALKVGDLVLTYHAGTNTRGLWPLKAVSTQDDTERWDLTLVDGLVLTFSVHHRLFLLDERVVAIEDLEPGMVLAGDASRVVAGVALRDRGLVIALSVDMAATFQTSGVLNSNVKPL